MAAKISQTTYGRECTIDQLMPNMLYEIVRNASSLGMVYDGDLCFLGGDSVLVLVSGKGHSVCISSLVIDEPFKSKAASFSDVVFRSAPPGTEFLLTGTTV